MKKILANGCKKVERGNRIKSLYAYFPNYSKDEIISMYNVCLKEIREIDDEHYLKFA